MRRECQQHSACVCHSLSHFVFAPFRHGARYTVYSSLRLLHAYMQSVWCTLSPLCLGALPRSDRPRIEYKKTKSPLAAKHRNFTQNATNQAAVVYDDDDDVWCGVLCTIMMMIFFSSILFCSVSFCFVSFCF